MRRLIRLNSSDTVAVALSALEPGEATDGVVAIGAIPVGHKIAIAPVKQGQPILKYGQVIGVALSDIAIGSHVHGHNCGMTDPEIAIPSDRDRVLPQPARRSFDGYLRPDGRAGTRNFVAIMASVNCSSTVCNAIASAANNELLPRFDGIDGYCQKKLA